MISNDYELNEEEKHIYIKTLCSLAHIDGLHDKELAFLDSQASLLGLELRSFLDESSLNKEIDFSKIPEKLKKILIRDMLILAYIDGKYSDEEESHLKEVAHSMDLESSVFDNIHQWLKEYWILLEKAQTIFV